MTEIKFSELIATIRNIGDAIIARSDNKVTWAANWETTLRGHYEPFKEKAKKENTRDPNELLDRHKVGACMMISILATRPLRTVDDSRPTPRWETVNQRLSLYIGIFIFRRYGVEDAKDSGDKDALTMHTASFNMPFPINKDGSYEDQTVRALYEATMAQRLDVFILANLLFLLDTHHRATYAP
ncbi:MAG: hypothetical protein KGZ83_00650 [Sulfuricella sp.]|nr:hypothetical protein [Sulfuricella sp.]